MSLLSMMRVTLHTVSANVRLTRTVLIIDYFWCRVVGPSVHASLDLYALIAVTPSSSTLDELINVVKADNDRRQQDADTSGDLLPRKLDVSVPLFECRGTFHPEHLPSFLTIYNLESCGHKIYVGLRGVAFASRAILVVLAYPHSVMILGAGVFFSDSMFSWS